MDPIWFWIITILFIVISVVMVLVILVQRPTGGGLAGAFGGAGGSGADSVFGGRVGDALTWATVVMFILYLGFAVTLNILDDKIGKPATAPVQPATVTAPEDGAGSESSAGETTAGETSTESTSESTSGESSE